MATTELTNAVAFPLDDGTGAVSDANERWDSGGYFGALSRAAPGSYVDRGLNLTNVDTANNEVDVTAGRAYVELEAADVSVQSTRGGSSSPAYDTTLSEPITVAVELPTDVTNLSLGSGTNDVYLAVDFDGTVTGTAGSVFLEFGISVSTPVNPSVLLGTVDTSDGSTTTPTDGPEITARSVNGKITVSDGRVAEVMDELANDSSIGIGETDTRANVQVKPQTTWTETGVTVPPGVMLDAWHATYSPGSDADGILVDNGAWVAINAQTDYSYSSDVVYLDTTLSTNGKYGPGGQGGSVNGAARVHIRHRIGQETSGGPTSATDGGRTLAFRDLIDPDGNRFGIANLPYVFVDSKKAGTGVACETQYDKTEGVNFVNMDLRVNIAGCHHHMHGTGPGQWRLNAWGSQQFAAGSEYGIRNEMNGPGPHFSGQFWDPTNVGTHTISGGNVTVEMTNAEPDQVLGTTDSSNATLVYSFTDNDNSYGLHMLDTAAAGGVVWKISPKFGGLRFFRDGTKYVEIEGGTGHIQIPNGGSSSDPAVKLSDGGAGFYLDSGEVHVVDEASNTTQLS